MAMRRFFKTRVRGLQLGLGLSFVFLGSGCFSEAITLDLPCTDDAQCGRGQVCDLATARCVMEGQGSETSGGSDGDLPPVETCSTDQNFRCAPTGTDIQRCDSDVWTPINCDDVCEGGKAGACVDEGSGAECSVDDPSPECPACLCADGVGGECEGFRPDTCTEPGGQLEFCLQGQVFRNDCSSDCAADGYPAAGPCVDPTMNGAYCICADNVAGNCSSTQDFVETCEGPTIASICVDGTVYETDCLAECMRQGAPGGACMNGQCNCL